MVACLHVSSHFWGLIQQTIVKANKRLAWCMITVICNCAVTFLKSLVIGLLNVRIGSHSCNTETTQSPCEITS